MDTAGTSTLEDRRAAVRAGALLVAVRDDSAVDDRLRRRERLLHELALERQRRSRRRSA